MATLESASRRLSATRELDLTKFYFYQQQASGARRQLQTKSGPERPEEAADELGGEADSAGWSSRGPRNRSSSNEPESPPATTSSSAHSFARYLNQQASSRKFSQQAAHESECEVVIKSYSRLCELDVELAAVKANQVPRWPNENNNNNNNNYNGNQQQQQQQQTISRSANKLAAADLPLSPDGATPSIEERLRRLLELEPPVVAAGDQLRRHEINYHTHQAAHVVRQRPSAIASQLQNQLKLVASNTKKSGQHQLASEHVDSGRTLIMPADRMMIFMLASKRVASLNENSLAEKNRRVLKWLEDCCEAATGSPPG